MVSLYICDFFYQPLHWKKKSIIFVRSQQLMGTINGDKVYLLNKNLIFLGVRLKKILRLFIAFLGILHSPTYLCFSNLLQINNSFHRKHRKHENIYFSYNVSCVVIFLSWNFQVLLSLFSLIKKIPCLSRMIKNEKS